ncbi:alpha/beta hydrolase [Actinomadura litoris]|uniref:Alpha/beta hydrolase n=1 Tax=Actinomadura litoris TaxID=2678616 RepID=A0A7K1KX44_9ACTN|nr:alpha/beta hydrolase [Actinomadura litoris]MUN36772.1 alpha/beta hydrolase [Actinomadura litoris]
MNDVEELKRFVIVHARAQNLPADLYEGVLDRIRHDGEGEGSWAAEWSAAARTLEDAGDPLAACRCFTIARFPFVDGLPRRTAMRDAWRVFETWRGADIGVLDLEGRLRCWTSGLSREEPRPLLVVMGGIVSTKEQWAPLLLQADALGMAMLVTEMPGIGHNTLPYDRASPGMLPAILDALADQASVGDTYAVANSFSGHMALRAAVSDRRIRGVITNGAPIHDFFTDPDWLRALPQITRATLAHLTGTTPDDLPDVLGDWALTPDELSALEIPVSYTVSLRDEITPPSEIAHLRKHVKELWVKEFDDVHASPAHLDETRAWLLESLLRMRTPS